MPKSLADYQDMQVQVKFPGSQGKILQEEAVRNEQILLGLYSMLDTEFTV